MSRTTRRVFALLLAVYALTAAGYLAMGDEETMYRVARNWAGGAGPAVGRESVTLPAQESAGFFPAQPLPLETTSAVPGRGGALVSKYAPGQSLLGLPLFGAGWLLDGLWPDWPQLGPRLAMALLNPLALAASAALLAQFVIQLGYAETWGVALALAFGLTTMAWPYVNTFYPQPATGFFLLLAAFALERWRVTRGDGWAWGIGVAAGAAILLRNTAAIILPGLALALWLETRGWPEKLRVASRVGVPLVLAVAASLAYNVWRFGAPFETGYAEVAWTTPPLLGLYGLLVSPGKGVFLYSPLLLLALAALPIFYRRHRTLVLLLGAWWLSYLAFYAPYNFWTGGVNWGPRFLLPLLAVSLLPLAALLSEPQVRLALPLFVLLAAAGLLIQFPAVTVDHVRELRLQQASGDPRFYDRTLYNPAFSPLARQWPSALAVLRDFSRPEQRAAAANVLQSIARPPADSESNRVSAQRVLQAEFTRLNLPAIWWLWLPLWGVPGWLVVLLVAPWLALGGWAVLKG